MDPSCLCQGSCLCHGSILPFPGPTGTVQPPEVGEGVSGCPVSSAGVTVMVTMTVAVTAQGVPCPRPCRGEAAPSFRALPSLPAPLSYFSAAAFPPSLRHVRVGLELSRAAPAPGWALSWALSCSHILALPITALTLLLVLAGLCGRIHGNKTLREWGQKGLGVSPLPRDPKCRAGRAWRDGPAPHPPGSAVILWNPG